MNTSDYEKKYIECLKKRQKELINLPMPEPDKEAYLLYFETGNRLEYEKIYFSRREYLTIFGLAAVLDKSTEPDLAFAIIESVLNEPTWVLPAHGSREHIEGKKQSIDLFAAETAGALAEIIYLLYNNDKYISVAIHFLNEIQNRIFDIFLSGNPCDWWETAGMNWAAVCAGNIGIAAYYVKKLQTLLKDNHIPQVLSSEAYETIMDRVTDSMLCYLNSMGKDGACSEGVGYYKYGMEYFLKFYEILRDEARWKNISKIGDFHSIALFLQKVYLGNGNSVNFSDSLLKNKMKTGILCILSSIYDDIKINEDFVRDDTLKFNTELMEILGGEECHRWLGAYSDYIWVKNYGKNLNTDIGINNKKDLENTEGYSFFEETQWYIKKWSSDTSFYIKGGNNDESHNHNDIGSFGYIFEGEEILCDLGSGEYTKDYFGENRYEILCTGSKGHNVPVLDGLYQKSGKKYHADEFYGSENSVTVSFGAAYDNKSSYIVKRTVTFGETGSFSISDHIKGAEKISERLITRIKPKIKNNTVILDNGKTAIFVNFSYREQTYIIQAGKENILTDTVENKSCLIRIMEETHINHSGNKEKIYIICCDYKQSTSQQIRLNKYLSEHGICSRREADRLIEAGRVTIDGKKAVTGMKILPTSIVYVDGKKTGKKNEMILIALNKPAGIECTSSKSVKNNIVDFVGLDKRVYPIGRLDKNSEGLILLTNNGDIVNKIMKASACHEKEYIVTVNRDITDDFIHKMSNGIHLKDTRNGKVILDEVTRKCKVNKINKRTFNIILTQGLNRQIRRMCGELGYNVITLKRVRIMNILLGNLKMGQYRKVTKEEYAELMKEIEK